METIVKDGVEYKLVPLHKKQEANNYALFVLTMPGKGSWNGKWTGDGEFFARAIPAFRYGKPLYPNLKEGSYGYFWDDGWSASVKVTFITKSEAMKARRKSKGFCGYDWMISDLMKYGEIRER
jgi:hypothetical protein